MAQRNPLPFPVLLPLLAALAGGTLAPPALAQDEPKQDPAIAEKAAEIKKMVKDRKMEQDGAAAAKVLILADAFAKLHPKDKDKVVDAAESCLFDGRLRPPDQTVLYHSAAEALGKMGEDGAKPLRKAIDGSRFPDREYTVLKVALIEALGRTGDPRQAELLLELARRSPFDEIMAAAGGALGDLKGLDLKMRREVVKDLIRRWGELEAKGNQLDPAPNSGGGPVDFSGQNARKTLGQVRPKWVKSLQTLTGQSHREFEDWQRWLNKEPDWQPPGGGK